MSRVHRAPLPALTSLRFFAASAVVLFHSATGSLGETIPLDGVAKRLAVNGHVAVTFFFVLSGFIMTYAHAGRSEVDRLDIRNATFWRLRIARIIPAYLLGLIIAVPILVHFLLSGLPLWDKIAGPILVVFFLQAWWPPLSLTWNYPAWSLSVEAAFYALFPWLSRSSVGLSRLWLFAIAYCLIVIATVYRASVVTDPRTHYLPLFHLPVFIFGMALSRQFIFGRTLSPTTHGIMFCIGVASLLTTLGIENMPEWTESDAVLVPLFSLIIFGAARRNLLTNLLTSPTIILLGEASYAIFVLHAPLRPWWDALQLGLPVWWDTLLYFGTLVGFSILTFRCVETPMRKAISSNQSVHQLLDRRTWLRSRPPA